MGLPKGRTNNPGGRPKKGETFTDVLEKKYNKEQLIDALWKKAIEENNFSSLKYLADRWEGTPKQTIAGDPNAPLLPSVKIVFEDADESDSTESP